MLEDQSVALRHLLKASDWLCLSLTLRLVLGKRFLRHFTFVWYCRSLQYSNNSIVFQPTVWISMRYCMLSLGDGLPCPSGESSACLLICGIKRFLYHTSHNTVRSRSLKDNILCGWHGDMGKNLKTHLKTFIIIDGKNSYITTNHRV